MITIRHSTPETAAALAAEAGVDPTAFAMELKSGEERWGYGLYTVDGSLAHLLFVSADEPVLEEGIIRAMLNAAELKGCVTADCRDADRAAMLRHLEFSEADGVFTVCIPEFFHKGCSAERGNA